MYPRTFERDRSSMDTALLLIVVALASYLLFALIHPERF
jgi:K+-transporting ATPase KdpF subunit